MNHQFAEDVNAGLSASPKFLPSKYFYDKTGDRIFQEIMHMPEYYLTNSEFEIFTSHAHSLLQHFASGHSHFKLVEFGAGDGMKTKVLLRHFLEQGTNFEYLPIDISGHVLDILSTSLHNELPNLKVTPVENDYFTALKTLKRNSPGRKVVLFLGSNIGNFSKQGAASFLQQMARQLNPGDLLLLGADLKKHPDTILSAYNDAGGITRAFNLNLLHRINKELQADFNPQQFIHSPCYDPETGACKSFLVSTKAQKIHSEALGKTWELEAWETIFMEVSQKYGPGELERMARQSGFELVNHFLDCKHYFTDSLFRVR